MLDLGVKLFINITETTETALDVTTDLQSDERSSQARNWEPTRRCNTGFQGSTHSCKQTSRGYRSH